MIALYNATNGTNWRDDDNWLSDRPLYDWFGLKVNADGRVTEIDLSPKWLTGTLPPELGDLDQLRRLDLSRSRLTGAIPREIGRLTQLESIYLNGNDLTGPIPHELGLLPKLRRIDFSFNSLSGEIPPSLLRSKSITTINIGANDLTGPIPGQFSELSEIRFLRLYANQLNSEVPPNIGQLRHLQELWINDNQLTGEIPNSVGRLLRLRHLAASNNRFTGQIPEELSELHRLEWLGLDNNQLTGTIPKGLGDIESLERLEIVENDFTGCIPNNLLQVEESNINFANIPVCGEPTRTVPTIPAYIHLVFGDAVSQSETLAAQLAVQWVSEFLVDIGLPTPENTITVYVADEQGLALSYSNHVEGCDLDCADDIIDGWWGAVEPGAVFVSSTGLSGSSGFALERMARLVYGAIQMDHADGPSSNLVQRNPEWLYGGTATLVGLLGAADVMRNSRDERRPKISDEASPVFEPLWELEDVRFVHLNRHVVYHPVGAAAVDLLASQVGLRKLTEFFTARNTGEDWRQTFQRIFNISVPDFYELFIKHHRDGYPLRELPIIGSTDWP